MRLLVTCELLAHAEFYANHPQLKEMTSVEGAYTLTNLITVLLSEETSSKVYNGKADAVPDAITMLAKVVSRQWVYATPYHVMALASVIGRPVYSVYPDIKSCARVKSTIHREFFPRQMFLSEDDFFYMPPPIHIMWTTVRPEDLSSWKPNHFVPLMPSDKQSFGGQRVWSSYADVVKGQIADREAKRNKDKVAGVQKGEISPSIKSKIAEKEEEKGNRTDENAKQQDEPHLTILPGKDQSSIQEQRNGTSKPLQPKKSAESQRKKGDEAELAATLGKAPGEKCNHKVEKGQISTAK